MKMKQNGNSHRHGGFQPTGFQPTRAGRPNFSEANKTFFATCELYGLLHKEMGILQALVVCLAIDREITSSGLYGKDLTDAQRTEIRTRVLEKNPEVRRATHTD